ncbi:hypothetical protein ACPOL_3012 [Acidisarcina polymorpha]|uniref:Uncharacterized protein n=1 Tax=Acidisarcina polymorpha TaxID=2211140 RepID=A0A2Z5G0L6_9BACT|nr:hypothetical protein ACPOL_3012 [Acidisarcina polymorpha]
MSPDLHFSFSRSKGWCINGQPFDPGRTDALVADDTTSSGGSAATGNALCTFMVFTFK